MASDPIPIIEVSGTHRQVGHAIGEALRPTIQRLIEEGRSTLPAGISRNALTQTASLCLTHTRSVYPHYVEELEGIADAAAVPFEEVFLSHCEELWEKGMWRGRARGCTDMAARGRATVDGATLLAHTNDLGSESEKDLVILKVQAGDEPQFLGVSVGGLGYSAGYNAAGVSLTGNEVTSDDVRPGVPRLVVVRAILAARRLGEAATAGLQLQQHYCGCLG
jgi:isopenicillin-N N-acyltransferase-like protein